MRYMTKVAKCLLLLLIALTVSISVTCNSRITYAPLSTPTIVASTQPTQGRIAFYATAEPFGTGEGDIYLVTTDGRVQQLTHTGNSRHPVWSPDGRRIAFVSWGELCVMDADGSHQACLTKDIKGEGRGSVDSPPTWSPDGQQIAFESTVSVRSIIHMIRADGGSPRISIGTGTPRSPMWSPNGQYIAVTDVGDHRLSRIAVLNLYEKRWDIISGETHYCDRDCFTDGTPIWLSGSQQIVFVSTREGGPNVYVINVNGNGLMRLTNQGGRSPSEAPDGQRIAFVSERDGNPEIYVMDADGKNQTRLTNHPATDDSPAWSPDGKQIAFVSDRDGQREIYVMNADGSNQTRLTNSPRDKWNPVWAPW